MNWLINTLGTSIGKKLLMAVTGLCFCGFLVAHLAGNLTLYSGKDLFNAYAEHLHSLGPLLKVAEVSLLIVFVLHVFFGVSLYIENLQARPERYSVNKNDGGRTLGSMTMPYSGVIIAIFLGIHLSTLSFFGDELSVLDLLRGYLGQPMMVAIYVCGLFALTLHISHGFWSMFQTFGVNHPQYDCFIKRSTLVIALVAGAVFILIPILVYFKGIPN